MHVSHKLWETGSTEKVSSSLAPGYPTIRGPELFPTMGAQGKALLFLLRKEGQTTPLSRVTSVVVMYRSLLSH